MYSQPASASLFFIGDFASFGCFLLDDGYSMHGMYFKDTILQGMLFLLLGWHLG